MKDLYREVVLERYRRPHHRGLLDGPSHQAQAHNPLCGDELTIFLQVEQNRLVNVTFEARGCSISQASADLMIDAVQGCDVVETMSLIKAFRELFDEEPRESPLDVGPDLGEARVLREVRAYPVRIKCALLAWDVLERALLGGGGEAVT